jgi:hypothetical protein
MWREVESIVIAATSIWRDIPRAPWNRTLGPGQYCGSNPSGSAVLRLDTLPSGDINNATDQVLPAAGWSVVK